MTAAALAAAIACGSSGAGGASDASNASSGAATPPPSPLDDGGGMTFDASSGGPDGGGTAVGEVYGHSADTLYELEPFSKAVTVVGKLDCITVVTGVLGPCGDGLWDVAIDKDGNMVGTAMSVGDVVCQNPVGHLVTIDKSTAHCTITKSVPGQKFPNSLTYVPVGTIDAAKETLVGYVGADYMQIDPSTGTMTKIGSLDPNTTGKSWYSSGDIVAVAGGKTYLTAKPDSSATYAGTDTLLEVDPKTGVALKIVGDTGFAKLWGVGFWAGSVYGFSAAGQLCAIDTTPAQAGGARVVGRRHDDDRPAHAAALTLAAARMWCSLPPCSEGARSVRSRRKRARSPICSATRCSCARRSSRSSRG